MNLPKERRLHLCTKSFILCKNASLAQRLEHRICNARVVGSIPTGGLCFILRLITIQLCLQFRPFLWSSFFCLGRLMDGLQPSKLFCVGSNPIRDVIDTPVWRLPRFCGNTQYGRVAYGSARLQRNKKISILYLKASSFLLHQEVMNGCKFQEELQGIQQINQ